MSNTPRTDAVAYDAGGIQHDQGSIVPADFARTLERELAAEQQAHHDKEEHLILGNLRLRDELAQTRAENERLKRELGDASARAGQ